MYLKLYTISTLLLTPFLFLAQNIGINETGTPPSNDAGLDINFNDKGLLIPRLTSAQRSSIQNPSHGLMIFNLDCDALQFVDNTGGWTSLPASSVFPQTPSASGGTNINQTDFDANWIPVNGAIDYFIDVADDAGFSNIIINNQSVGNVTTYNVSGLTCNTAYFYRIRADNGCNISPNSGIISVTTAACVPSWSYPLCDGSGDMDIVDVTNPLTGDTCMDRNLGAKQVAQSHLDNDAYGDLFQWGRGADGHQCRTSNTVYVNSSTDSPGHGDFITGADDWRTPNNDLLWQGVNGINNPCPPGYRLPTESEWGTESQTWSSFSPANALGSPLLFTVAGYRNGNVANNGGFIFVDSRGFYWSSTISSSNPNMSKYLLINNGTVYDDKRMYGMSVRCIKD